MANSLYTAARESFLKGEISWDSDDIRVILLSSGYTVNLSTHQYLSDVAGGGVRVATSSALSSKTTTGGVADAANPVFTAVSGSEVTQFIIYQHTGTESTSRLIAHFDTATNLPLTPSGVDITLEFSGDSNKIFKI